MIATTIPKKNAFGFASARSVSPHRWRRGRQGHRDPDGRPVELPEANGIVEIAEVGGLHHRYVRQAA